MTNIALLLIEDSLVRTTLIRDLLEEEQLILFNVTVAQRLAEATTLLTSHPFDLVLLDLGLPDSPGGLNSLLAMQQLANVPPIIVLTGLDDSNLALEAVRQGAQDYLVYGRFGGELLVRAINYAIERHRIQRELKAQKRELQIQVEREQLLGRTIERIRQSLKLEKIMQTTVEEVLNFLDTDLVLIYRCQNHEKGTILAEAHSSSYSSSGRLELSAALLQELSIQAAVTAYPFSEYREIAWNKLLKTLVNSVLTVPIWQNKSPRTIQLWGQLIACHYREPRQWQDWEVQLLTRLANQVEIAIRQSNLYEESQRQAAVDGLTGVANRRVFNRKLVQEWRRARREQTPLALIMCDIDYFKQYNDSYGHPQGDRCLQQVAKTLQKSAKRPADLVARYGGEEFAIILPKTDLQGALFVANSIRQALAQQAIAHRDSLVSSVVTLSMGIATQTPRQDQTSSQNLLRQADRLLLLAKQQGRDRIVTA